MHLISRILFGALLSRALFYTILCAFVSSVLLGLSANAGVREDVQNLFDQNFDEVDLARVKVNVDQMIAPRLDVEAQLAQINEMVASINGMLPSNADSWTKVEAIRKYIYQRGEWNGDNAFSYDHDDPYGLDVRNKLLSDYIQDRRGNCITMPFLFIILGQRLGLDVTPAMAPLHVFVKFTDDRGLTHNLEATSGAGPARDSHYRKLLPITDASISNKVFLAPLTNEQAIAVIAAIVVEHLIAEKRYHDAMAVADILLEHYPTFAYIMVKKATAAYHLLKSEFYDKFPKVSDVPQDKRPYLAHLQRINQNMFDRAENLGWRPVQR